MKKRLLLYASFGLFLTPAFGQDVSTSVLNSSGGEGKSGTMTIAWSVGEVVTETFQQGDVWLTQGLFQPEIIITSVKEIAGILYDIRVFPNPSRDLLNIRFDRHPGEKTTWWLFGQGGNVMKTGVLDGLTETFSLEELPAGIYFLRIISGQTELKVFKIVKQ
ncbi:MAG: T9SS type A sorting domain-containing protein [Bacteroidales bacterium]